MADDLETHASLRDMLQRCSEQVGILTADNARLRAALELIADIGEGSTTANSLPHIARLARKALAVGNARDL
jgi:hypothetical protein